jgi:hypothetical protein
MHRLLFCNEPERIKGAGAYADALLEAGVTYTVFYHYRNNTSATGDFVVALHGTSVPLRFTARQGTGDPRRDPPLAGRQAMARFLSTSEAPLLGRKGTARFACKLATKQVASGILQVRCEQTVRLRIYFRHDRWLVKGARVVILDDPRREIAVALRPGARTQYFRIGEPEPGMSRHLDGTYGMLYAFKVDAPEGRRVRVAFSPRGGKGGMVGSVNGKLRQSGIVPATHWRVFCESVVGPNGLILTTAPFGGVFYPVELRFDLL